MNERLRPPDPHEVSAEIERLRVRCQISVQVGDGRWFTGQVTSGPVVDDDGTETWTFAQFPEFANRLTAGGLPAWRR